ncbi:hypothetical protein ABC766_31860 (plasmid) [Methylobacterium fujisawaense]|uniref:hypothetical protein n=1 Tax=Methylobacterium fujisawaense TaxID=107400 RepID=UPI0031F5CECB
MTPEAFLTEVVKSNVAAALTDPNDIRAIVNAILTLDALVGMIHAHGKAADKAGIAEYKRDDDYCEALAATSPSYRVLRDAAASLKHGELSHPRRKSLARLLRSPDALGSKPTSFGTYNFGRPFGGHSIVIEYDPGPGYALASHIIAETYQMLEGIAAGEPAGPS